MLELRRQGILFVVSAPSGAGKSTLLHSLQQTPDFVYSISCTTRAPRQGEADGRDYHFLSTADFERRIAAGDFLEHARVHGNHYGTLREGVLEKLHAGIDVLIDVDVQGAHAIRGDATPEIRQALADVFILPPSREELQRRLLKRGTESPEQIGLRLKNAAAEMEAWSEYRYALVTGSIEDDYRNFRAIMHAERSLTRRLSLAK